MALYCTVDEFISAYSGDGVRIDIALPTTGPDSSRALLANYVSAASAEIDGLLAEAGYDLPLPTGGDAPAVERANLLKQRCIQLVCNYLKPGHDAVSSAEGVMLSAFATWRECLIGRRGVDGRGRLTRVASASLPGLARIA